MSKDSTHPPLFWASNIEDGRLEFPNPSLVKHKEKGLPPFCALTVGILLGGVYPPSSTKGVHPSQHAAAAAAGVGVGGGFGMEGVCPGRVGFEGVGSEGVGFERVGVE